MNESGPPDPGSEPDEGARGGRRRWLSGACAGLLVILVVYYLVTFAGVVAASRRHYDPATDGREGPRAAIVLGAAQYNGEPSPVLQGRLDIAADLYREGAVELIVVTGGGRATDVTTEAKTGYDYLREQTGIPDEQLRLEVQGASTYESLAASARFLRREGVLDVVLVTDPYHAQRTLLVAEEVGLRPEVALTDQTPSLRRLVQESAAVAVGRVISFRRLERL